MKKLSVIWIVIDSVRSFRTGLDDRDRIDIMDKFAKDAVEFTNAITSAPSSMLSASTMFTGLPACIIGRHFNDWKFDEKKIDSLPNTLLSEGYAIHTILNSREERLALQNLMHPLSKKYFPKGVSHNNWWTNKECTDILENVLAKTNYKSPAFYHLWYDVRGDSNTSREVSRALELFKKYGIYDNSIIVICSDHGYPDPSTGLTGETMRKYTHDMIVTDDNIRVPLFLKYPGSPKNIKIKEVVGTIDIFPTICNILEIPFKNRKFRYTGESLINLIKGCKKWSGIVRTDTRLNLSTGRITSLRSDRYKYVYYWDKNSEEFYDLARDVYETKNVLSRKNNKNIMKIMKRFRKIRNGMEDYINKFHISSLNENFNRNMNKSFSKKKREGVSRIVLIVKDAPEIIVRCFLDSAKNTFPNAKIDILDDNHDYKIYKGLNFDNAYSINNLNTSNLSKSGIIKNRYDIVFYLTEKARFMFVDSNIIGMIKRLNVKSSFMLDYNFDTYNEFLSKWIAPIRRYMIRNTKYYREEPSLFFKDILLMVKAGINHNIKKSRLNAIDVDKVKKMRDRQIKANRKVE